MSCASCHLRKERRYCPAVHERICAQCCGSERENTLDCPPECEYLREFHRRELPRPLEAFDAQQTLARIEVPAQFVYEHEPLLVGLSYGLAKAARADASLHDRDLLGAVSALTSRYERLAGSGLLYDDQQVGVAQHAIVQQLEQMVAEYRALEEKNLGHHTLHDRDVLHALVFLVRIGLTRTTGRPRARAFIAFLNQQFPQKEPAIVGLGAGGSKLIVP